MEGGIVNLKVFNNRLSQLQAMILFMAVRSKARKFIIFSSYSDGD